MTATIDEHGADLDVPEAAEATPEFERAAAYRDQIAELREQRPEIEAIIDRLEPLIGS